MKLVDQQAIEFLFLKMTVHFNHNLPKNEEILNFMKEQYYEELKDYPESLVFNNLKNHIATSNFSPTIADLVRNDEMKSTIPGVEETRLMIEARDKEFENHVPADPKLVQRLLAETRQKLMEVRLNELDRQRRTSSEYRFGE